MLSNSSCTAAAAAASASVAAARRRSPFAATVSWCGGLPHSCSTSSSSPLSFAARCYSSRQQQQQQQRGGGGGEEEEEVETISVKEFGGPEVLVPTTKRLPPPSEGEVLVRLHAIGVNPVDTYIRSGTYGRLPPLPYTPGSEGSGVVEALGDGVNNLKVGDRVYVSSTTTGAYSAKALARAGQVHVLSDRATFDQGASLFVPAGTAFRALFPIARARENETVFVHGASGGVGLAAVQLARARGLKVIGTASTEEGRELVIKEGAHYVFDHKSPDYVPKVKQLAEKLGGINIILEMLANVNLSNDLNMISQHGRIVIIGNRGTATINPRDIMAKEAWVTGMQLALASPDEYKMIVAGLHEGLENGTLRPVVGRTYRLSEASKAHHDVINSSHLGNLVLRPGDDSRL